MSRRSLQHFSFKVGVLSVAAMAGVLECAALLRARVWGQVTGLRRA
jgi:hypothetical protein